VNGFHFVEVVTPPWPLTASGPLSREFTQQDVPHYFFVGHSEQMAEPPT